MSTDDSTTPECICGFCNEALSSELESVQPCTCPIQYHRPCINHVRSQSDSPRCDVCEYEYKTRYIYPHMRYIHQLFTVWSLHYIRIYALYVIFVSICQIGTSGWQTLPYGIAIGNVTYSTGVWISLLCTYIYRELRGWLYPLAFSFASMGILILHYHYNETWADWTATALASGLIVQAKTPLFIVSSEYPYTEVTECSTNARKNTIL